MTFSLLASACPSPQFRSAMISVGAAMGGTGNAPTSASVQAGASVWSPFARANATRQDLLGAYGGGAYFVANGLMLSAGTGLSVNVAAGQAVIDGIVELSGTTSIAVPASTSNVFIWLVQHSAGTNASVFVQGTLAYTTSTTPPAGAVCLLGNVTTSASAVTATDYSGVLYKLGSEFVRHTADSAKPTDTPPASFWHTVLTSGGAYRWMNGVYITWPTS